jgi:hypothetical protein
MNVDPVHGGSAGIERQTPENELHSALLARSADSGNNPKTEIARTENSPIPSSFPEHEVKVQLDTPSDDILVYQVLDKKSGDLVLQVPSVEVLSGIHRTQELLLRIASRGKVLTSDSVSAAALKGEGKNNGSKL